MLRVWSGLSPTLRARWLESAGDNGGRASALLDALASGQIAPQEVGPGARQRLRRHPDPTVRERAERQFAAVQSDRQSVVETYSAAWQAPGKPDRGRELFLSNCASCHEFGDDGIAVGPNLGAVVDKSPQALAIAILDPNRAVEERYLAYVARAASGREFTGLIASESPNNLTLRSAGGVEEVFLRGELKSLETTRRSLMPEGFEHSLDVANLADLIAYLSSNAPRPKSFPGNRPEQVRADPSGVLHLRASNAEIRGDSLVYEPAFGNLGYWQSENDVAAWTLQVSRGGEFEVWLDWARPGSGSTAPLEMSAAGVPVLLEVPPTGSWEEYRQQKVGQVNLAMGLQRISLRAVPPLAGAVLDLREIRLVPR